MCDTCGCGEEATVRLGEVLGHDAVHEYSGGHEHSGGHENSGGHDSSGAHEHGAAHEHQGEHDRSAAHARAYGRADEAAERTVVLEQRVLAKNDQLAQRNRERLAALGATAVNVMGSPGAGKTTLLERTVRALGGTLPLAVVEGDQETVLDADRIAAAGGRVVQINTGAGCHLDAGMLAGALDRLGPERGALVLVENVGNLVCPALFDLGAGAAAVLASVTEGADKPSKYPHMFRAADVVVLTKTDILPYVEFDVDAFIARVRAVNPGAEVLRLSATDGDGLEDWFAWLRDVRTAGAADRFVL
ncbi:hydrogenase nickel incorporation protein HypB [Actinocrinis puniceicyclus]|uniref:Hydrogenase nickel incorporation protein HypB n=1 Tax=Actinocrinis puniceicyclus TaxID=977794 RepID=A0A8J7WG03_9ACTN|nr:hydrogenase nickel incorporation protein HypB [Actinocrinis puniceicyclus]MBS2961501.1 hydrogenase nickel incorporation protein HypB [Actinocrinis puniceicyclus]